tara:strand:- start:55671 stop:56414 length:744 start_codon:yes stop_codon:yes gene_type:complete
MTRVLVVDDSATTRSVVRRALAMSGVPAAGIREAANGVEALLKISEERPQLVLSDVNMPSMDGFELLQEMRKRGHIGKIPVVMITSRSSLRDRNRLIELGAEAVIRKPFPVHALRTYIEPYLSVRSCGDPNDAANANATSLGAFGEEEFSEALTSALATTLELTAFLEAKPAKIPDSAFAGEFCADLLGNEADYAFGLPACDVLVGSDPRIASGYVFSLEQPEDILLAGHQPGSEVFLGDFRKGEVR